MTIVSANGDHTYSQSELADLVFLERQVGRETIKRHFRNADSMDWDHLFSMIPDSGHGRFWKEVLRSVRLEISR